MPNATSCRALVLKGWWNVHKEEVVLALFLQSFRLRDGVRENKGFRASWYQKGSFPLCDYCPGFSSFSLKNIQLLWGSLPWHFLPLTAPLSLLPSLLHPLLSQYWSTASIFTVVSCQIFLPWWNQSNRCMQTKLDSCPKPTVSSTDKDYATFQLSFSNIRSH